MGVAEVAVTETGVEILHETAETAVFECHWCLNSFSLKTNGQVAAKELYVQLIQVKLNRSFRAWLYNLYA